MINILTANLVQHVRVLDHGSALRRSNLSKWSPQALLAPIVLLHSFRHLGLMFLAPGGARRAAVERQASRRSSTTPLATSKFRG
jgi:hypothetical protein